MLNYLPGDGRYSALPVIVLSMPEPDEETLLAARFDIDLHRADFWRSSLKVIEEKVNRYTQL